MLCHYLLISTVLVCSSFKTVLLICACAKCVDMHRRAEQSFRGISQTTRTHSAQGRADSEDKHSANV